MNDTLSFFAGLVLFIACAWSLVNGFRTGTMTVPWGVWAVGARHRRPFTFWIFAVNNAVFAAGGVWLVARTLRFVPG
ncbi:hypothetical protein HZY97_00870 [Sphingomonas sp. R-74633]|uniref:hypothetical protein n=1 Tax=Sphingomonas sp. R-74633 TaxID=2751188 RepID=UPI0015D3DFC9|nr:hypothetical protein [Sphingomonas sp. R-74633]NYT39297.1 hypothetical protein [Sphingomonas sp. R-74633]